MTWKLAQGYGKQALVYLFIFCIKKLSVTFVQLEKLTRGTCKSYVSNCIVYVSN